LAIVIGDLHGSLDKAKAFLAFKPEKEHICVGDYFDSFHIGPTRQIECMRLLLDSKAVLLWGNHDIHYLKNPPFKCSGYQYEETTNILISHLINGNKRRFLAAYTVDGYILTHAGIHDELAKHDDIEKEARYLNGQMKRFLNSPKDSSFDIFNIPRSRGGWDNFGGIFWFDFKRDNGLSQKYKQIFGHTEGREPTKAQHHWAIDTTNSDINWIMDTETGLFEMIPYVD
jgi:predicted phosphodiesterase